MARRIVTVGGPATERLAELVAAGLEVGDVVALDGELGVGKTTWVRGLARGLGISEPVSSPTYCLMQEYPGRLTLHHFDAWMRGREESFLEDGGGQYLGGEGVAVVEWAERVAGWLPAPRLRVSLRHLGVERRLLELEVVPPSAREDGPASGAKAARLARLLEELPASGSAGPGASWSEAEAVPGGRGAPSARPPAGSERSG